jgi:hypothetical protein
MKEPLIFFFAAIHHSRLEEVHLLIYKYIDASAACIIGLEKADGVHLNTNGEHLHVCVEMSEEQWKPFYKTFVNKFNLGGKNSKDKSKSCYGRIKNDKIRDTTRFMAYTVKDKNVWTCNVSVSQLQYLIDTSFPKPPDLEHLLQNHLDSVIHNYYKGDDIEYFIALQVIDYYRVNSLNSLPNKHLIKKLTLKYMFGTSSFSNKDIYFKMYER